MRTFTYFLMLTLTAAFAATSALADPKEFVEKNVDEFMQSNTRFVIGGGVGLAASILEHKAVRDMEFTTQLRLLQQYHPKMHTRYIVATTEYMKNKSDPVARAKYVKIKSQVELLTRLTRQGKFLPEVSFYERHILKNLNRLKWGARVWGAGALGVMSYYGYESLKSANQDSKELKIKRPEQPTRDPAEKAKENSDAR